MAQLLGVSVYMPYGDCFLWRTDLLILHAGSGLLMSISCFSISAAVLSFLRKRGDDPSIVVKLLTMFFAFAGLAQLMTVVSIWYPAFVVVGGLKLMTAVVAAALAVILWPMIPKITNLPSRSELESRNRKIEELNAKLQQRIDSMGTLAGGVSHDFNNLLTVIRGHAQLMAQSTMSPEFLENVNAITNAAERATDVCRQMLAYSGRGHFMLEQLNLNDVIDNLALPLYPQVDFNYSLSSQLAPINASREQMEQLLNDLCANAIEAIGDTSQQRGSVTIRTANVAMNQDDLDKALFSHDLKPGDVVLVEVRDTGAGMSPQILDRLFEPYYSTKFTGRGLGMAAVQGIVRGHHGCIFIDTAPGEGTSVRVAFPVVGAKTETYQKPRVSNPGMVLLVDDEPDVLSLAREYLTSLGITTLATTDPGEALRLARRHKDRLDAVIIDFLLPYTTGSDLLMEISDICEVDAYLTSGYSRPEIDDPNLRRLLTGFIAKPFELADFRVLFAAEPLEVN